MAGKEHEITSNGITVASSMLSVSRYESNEDEGRVQGREDSGTENENE